MAMVGVDCSSIQTNKCDNEECKNITNRHKYGNEVSTDIIMRE